MIGYAFCGSFCTLSRSLKVLEELIKRGYDVLPIMSENVYNLDTRFWKATEFRKRVEDLCGRECVHNIVDAEPLGPKIHLDALIIAPCTGNTIAKIANGITDGCVCMAAKAHLRTDRPTLIALASNDCMSANLKNISTMLMRKQVFFLPMKQDEPIKKPHSLVAEFEMIPECLEMARRGEQARPLFL